MSISIGLIEDDDSIRQHLTDIITSSQHFTLQGAAKNGVEARQLIKENKTDIYLVDLGLPDVDGVELIALIKASCKDAKSLVITTFGDAKHINSSIRAGASGYLLKEDIGPELNEKIIALSNGLSPVSKSLVKYLFNEVSSSSAEKEDHPIGKEFSEFGLAARELDVLRSLVKGAPIFNIASDLEISVHTVNQHLRSIYKKLKVHSRSMAVRVAVQNGFAGS